MGTFPLEKAPIPLFVNRSQQIAPSYSYYDRPISLAGRSLPLYETRACFSQALTSPFPQTSSARLNRLWKSEDFQGWIQMQLVAVLTDYSIFASTW